MPAHKRISARKVKELHGQGRSDGEIAAALGCCRTRAGQLRRLMGLEPRQQRCRRWTRAERARLQQAVAEGRSHEEIGREMGRTTHSVTQAVCRYGLGGEDAYHHPLEQWARAWDLYRAGLSPAKVAELMGIHRTTAHKYKRRMPADWDSEDGRKAKRPKRSVPTQPTTEPEA